MYRGRAARRNPPGGHGVLSGDAREPWRRPPSGGAMRRHPVRAGAPRRTSPAHVHRPRAGRAQAEPRRLAGRVRLVGPARERPRAARRRDAVHGRGHPGRAAPRARGRTARRPGRDRPDADPPRPARRRGRGGRPGAPANGRADRRRHRQGAAIDAIRGRGRSVGRGDRPHGVRLLRGDRGPRDPRRRCVAHARRGPGPGDPVGGRGRGARGRGGRHAPPRLPPRRVAGPGRRDHGRVAARPRRPVVGRRPARAHGK